MSESTRYCVSAESASRLHKRNRELDLEVKRLQDILGSTFLCNEGIKSQLELSCMRSDLLLSQHAKLNVELLKARQQLKELAPRWFEFWRK